MGHENVCIYTMDFYLVLKQNKIINFAGKWMELETTTFSGGNPGIKYKYSMFSLICGYWLLRFQYVCYNLNNHRG